MTGCKRYEEYQIVFHRFLSFMVDALLSNGVGKVNTQDIDRNH